MMIVLLGALLSVCFGVLVGSAWTTQALNGKLRRRAIERRRLNDEWRSLQELREQYRRCLRCNDDLHHDRQLALVGAGDDDD